MPDTVETLQDFMRPSTDWTRNVHSLQANSAGLGELSCEQQPTLTEFEIFTGPPRTGGSSWVLPHRYRPLAASSTNSERERIALGVQHPEAVGVHGRSPDAARWLISDRSHY